MAVRLPTKRGAASAMVTAEAGIRVARAFSSAVIHHSSVNQEGSYRVLEGWVRLGLSKKRLYGLDSPSHDDLNMIFRDI